MKIKLLIGILIFLIVLNLATLGSYVYYRWINQPQPIVLPDTPHRSKHHGPLPRLDKTQRMKLHDLRREFMRKTGPYMRERFQKRERILQLLMEDKVDTIAVFQLMDEIAVLQKKVEREAVDMLIAARGFLSNRQLLFISRMLNDYNNLPGRGQMPMSGRGKFFPPGMKDTMIHQKLNKERSKK